ncbi:MAG: hypothetical protein AB1442_15320 [Nitrospirota bacterium]
MVVKVETGQFPDWFEAFKQKHDLASIPEAIRPDFVDFLLQRAAVRSIYEAIPENKFDEKIGEGDSVCQELIHQIGHSRLRIEGLQAGKVTSWQYFDVHPQEHQKLTHMSKDELMREFDAISVSLYELFIRTETQTINVLLPYGRTVSGARLLEEIVHHEILHLGICIKLGDHLGITRPTPVKRVWG